MGNFYNEIVFTKDIYNSNSKESRADLFAKVGKQLALLLEQGYECRVRDDDTDIIVIEFNHDNRFDDWGTPRLMWVTDVEEEDVLFNRSDEEIIE